MIDWVDSYGGAWGWQWRHMLEAEATGARSWWPTVIEHEVMGTGRSFEFLLGDALLFHVAFKRAEYRHRLILANHYIDPSPVKVKAAAFRIGVRTWWQRLHSAHVEMAQIIDERRYAQRAYARSGRLGT